jgi:hypothetical protein
VTNSDRRPGFNLLPNDNFQRIAHGLRRRTGASKSEAGKLLDQALAFVGTVAILHRDTRFLEAGHPLVLPQAIEEAWKEAILDTPSYRLLSELLGVFVDRMPHETPRQEDVEMTLAAVDCSGFVIYLDYWKGEPAESRAGVFGIC